MKHSYIYYLYNVYQVPVHKKGEKGLVENYRPISLTPFIMKVFEKCIRNELCRACEPYLDPRQHGFINSKSCTTQLVPLTYDLASGLNNKAKVDIIYFDFAKAFDSVSHDLILKKLRDKFKIYGLMLRFIKYICRTGDRNLLLEVLNRKYYLLSLASHKVPYWVHCCLLYLSTICLTVSQMIRADDTKIWREIDFSEDHFALQNDIDKLNEWSLANKMKFHPSKCKALSVSVSYQRNILHNLPFTKFIYKLGNVFIDYTESQVDLGVTPSRSQVRSIGLNNVINSLKVLDLSYPC